jgi:hypothetical protein
MGGGPKVFFQSLGFRLLLPLFITVGLAVVYGIVQRHGGQIEVESNVGRGTLFRLRLPRHPAAREEDSPAASDQ